MHRPAPGDARRIAEEFTFDRLVPEYERVFAEVRWYATLRRRAEGEW